MYRLSFRYLSSVLTSEEGYLICVPMSEEWQANKEVTELDGWQFQVGRFTPHKTLWASIRYALLRLVFLGVSSIPQILCVWTTKCGVGLMRTSSHKRCEVCTDFEVTIETQLLQDMDKYIGDLHSAIVGMFGALF